MALAVVLGVIFGHIRKKGVGHEGSRAPITRELLPANTLFYGFLFVGILLFAVVNRGKTLALHLIPEVLRIRGAGGKVVIDGPQVTLQALRAIRCGKRRRSGRGWLRLGCPPSTG